MQHKPLEVTPHLFQLGTKSFPVYLSMADEGMIIEGGTGPTFEIISAQIEYLGIDPKKIRNIVLTHTHSDHVGAVPRLRQLWPHMKIVAGPVAERFLKKENFIKDFLPGDKMIGDLLKEKGHIQEIPYEMEDYNFLADSVIEEGNVIDLGDGIKWEILYSPGHSPCHISLYEEKEGSLAMGDSTGYYDSELDVFWPNYFQSLEEYCNSIKKMMGITANRALLSHNGVIEGGTRTYLEKALKATQAYHQEILGRLDAGDDPKQICADKADWIVHIGALATYNILTFLCKIMLKNSEKDRDKNLFDI